MKGCRKDGRQGMTTDGMRDKEEWRVVSLIRRILMYEAEWKVDNGKRRKTGKSEKEGKK